MDTPSHQLGATLVPNAPGLQLAQLHTADQTITIALTSSAPTASCPRCAALTTRIHSRYTRTLADLPWGTFAVHLALHVRKFVCTIQDCPRRIFTERLPTVVAPYARRTTRLGDILRVIGFALGGEAGSRLVDRLGLATSPSTLLRLIRRTNPPVPATPRVLGVDDFAQRKGQRYGTLLVDLEQHRPVDLLPDRSADTLATWLRAHPGVEIISRDRSTEYTRGATEGAPQAIQVADRFHLLSNLREALTRLLDRHRTQFRGIVLPQPTPDDSSMPMVPVDMQRRPVRRSPTEETARQARRTHRQERHQQIHALHAQGSSIRGIAQRLHLSRGTVYRYLRLDAQAAAVGSRHVPSMLDPYLPYLYHRWIAGCQNGLQLWRDLQARGYPGSRKMVANWVRQQRQTPAPTTPRKYRAQGCAQAGAQQDSGPNPQPAASTARIPSVRQLAWLVLHDPESLTMAEQATLTQVQEACPEVTVAYPLVHAFLQMVRQRTPEALDPWLTKVAASQLPDLHGFAVGLERDKAAVLAALTLEWSTGQVEGQVNRLKLLKRQMYGRANFDLLRQRVLQAA